MTTSTWTTGECVLPDGTPWWAASQGDTRMLYDEIFVDGVYADFAATSKAGRLIVDVGANTGLSSWFFSRAAPEVPILAIEPVPLTYGCLVQNLARYAPGATPVQTAVGTVPGAVDLTYYPRTPSQSGVHADAERDDLLTAAYLRNAGLDEVAVAGALRGLHEGISTRVPRSTLEQLLDAFAPTVGNGVFVKVDVERAELEVLKGLGDRWPAVEGVICEVEDSGSTLEHVSRTLEGRGFAVDAWEQESLGGSGLWTVSASR